MVPRRPIFSPGKQQLRPTMFAWFAVHLSLTFCIKFDPELVDMHKRR
jgi:hypothetical protein